MPLRKHDSMVITEIISAFSLIGIFSIALMLFFIHQDFARQNLHANPAPVQQANHKIMVKDLDPAFVGEIANAINQLNISQQMSNEEVKFFMNKVLEKNFSKEEITGLSEEFTAIRKQQIDAAKAAAQQQKQAQKAPEKATPNTPPAQ